MFGLTHPGAVYLSTSATDMRKSIDGLSGEVHKFINRNPVEGGLFVFFNRRRDKVKMLWWDRDGFWVFYKRLEAGTFQQPTFQTDATHGELAPEQLGLILAGVDLSTVRMRKRYRLGA